MSDTSLPAKSSARIPELDGVRGVAILLVLLWHYYFCQTSGHEPSLINVMLGLCWSGVDLFFVLSGFLIGGILLDNKGASNYFQVFYIRRSCRIFPLYYAWIFLFIGLGFFMKPQIFGTPEPLAAFLTYTQNFAMAARSSLNPSSLGITWSLALEEQFYLFLPLLIYILPRRHIPLALIFLILIAPIVRIVLYPLSLQPGYYSFTMMPGRMDGLLLGALAAYLYRDERARAFITKMTLPIYFLLVVLFFLIMISSCQPQNIQLILHLVGLLTRDMSLYGFSLIALFYFGILLVAITEKKGPVSTIARWRPLQKLGIMSYGVYIYHQTIAELIHGIFRKQSPVIANSLDAWATAASLVITILVAYVSWHHFEKRIVAWGHRFNYKHTP